MRSVAAEEAQPTSEDLSESFAVFCAEVCEQSVFVLEVGSECAVDERNTGGGESDDALACVAGLYPSFDQATLF